MLVALFFIESLNIFWGFDIKDSGYHMVFYENIFDAPESVKELFSTYLTGLVGGLFLKLFPFLGIVGLRILHVLLLFLSFTMLYIALRRIISVIHFIIGFSLVVFSSLTLPSVFYNANLTSFFYVLMSICIYNGLIQKNLLWIVCGGIVCALNTFARIPNILGCSFVLVIFVGGLIKNEKRIQTIRKTLAFFMGFLTGALSVLLMMMYLGHLDLFLDSMISLNHTAISSEEVGNTTHSLQNLILVQVKFYFQLSKIVIVLAALLFFSRKLENNRYRYIIGGVVFIWMLVFSYIGVSVYDILCALCIIGCCYAIMFKPLEYKTIAALGLLMLTLQPCGSDFVHNQGAFSAVVAAPIASYSLVRKSNVHIIIPVYIVALFIIVCICHFFDRGKIWELNYMFKQKELRFIHSSNYKTRIIDETMSEISSYVIQGDTLLVYPCAPMMNYLTHTRPFKSYLYSSSLIVISGKLKDVSDSFPKVLIDKTTSTDWSEVNEFVLNDDRIDNLDNDGLMTIERFLVKHNYSRVFENSCFVLFVKK